MVTVFSIYLLAQSIKRVGGKRWEEVGKKREEMRKRWEVLYRGRSMGWVVKKGGSMSMG